MRLGALVVSAVWLYGATPAAADGLQAPLLTLAPVVDADAAAPAQDGPPWDMSGAEQHLLLGGLPYGRLAEHHATWGGFVYFDVTKVLRGGLDTEATAVRYLGEFHLLVGGENWGRPGDLAFLQLLAHDQSENRDATVGDINGFDNIDGTRFVQISQLWYKLVLGGGAGVLKFGKMDANADVAADPSQAWVGFSLIEHSPDFQQSAAVYSPTMFPMVTYPDPAPGAALFAGSRTQYVAGGAFYSNSQQTFLDLAGHPETVERTHGGAFLITEWGARGRWIGDMEAHVAIGAWYHTGRFPRIDRPEETQRGAFGGYAFVDQPLYQEKSGDTVSRDLGVFFHAGLADPSDSPMSENVTLGLAARGFTPARPNDSMGVLGTWTRLASPEGGRSHNFELATEAYYKIQIVPWASLKPSFAYIFNPSGDLPDAAVATVRAEVDF